MKKPTFSNKRITSENKYLRTIQRDFIDSQWRGWNIITLEWVNWKWWSFIFALTNDKKVILNKEYKFWPDKFIYTFPSWWIDGESDEKNALNELEEETWYSSDEKIIYIWETIQNWYIVWINKLFFVKNCYKKLKENTHEWEEISVEFLEIEKLHDMVINWKIIDPYTLVNYFLVKEKTNNFNNLNLIN